MIGLLMAYMDCQLFVYLQALEYPQRRYQVLLQSATGPIDVYLVR